MACTVCCVRLLGEMVFTSFEAVLVWTGRARDEKVDCTTGILHKDLLHKDLLHKDFDMEELVLV
jgi:hypothetical protein